MIKSADLVIVGGGIIGLALAWTLRDSGLRIVVLDRQQPAQAASWAGGGILSPLPPDHHDPVLAPLLARSLELFPRFCSQLHEASGIDPQFWRCGARYFADGQVREFPQIAQIRNPRLLQALLSAVEISGTSVIANTAVSSWIVRGERLAGVQTDRGVIECGQAVLAAGAWSGQLLPLPVWPIKGQMLLLRAPPGALDKILIGPEAYLVPRRDGLILCGSTLEESGFDTGVTCEARDWLLSRARELWPAIGELPLERHWAGLRPGSPQGHPVIAAVPQIQGLYCCGGHFRIGLTLAPASAELLAGMLAGDVQATERATPFAYRMAAPA